jgi:MFS family permease
VGFFAIGVGPIPWLLMAEIFPAEVRGTACTLATVVNWSGSFMITLSCDSLTKLLGYEGLFFLYAAVCAMGVVYTHVLVVETKGKSLEEITMMLAGTRGGNPLLNAPLAPIVSSPNIPK